MAPSQAQRVTDAARELNVARLPPHGRRAHRTAGSHRRAATGLALPSSAHGREAREDNAVLARGWVRTTSSMRTRVAQIWRDDGGWQLIREQRVGRLGCSAKVPGAPEPHATSSFRRA
jgi:hypothetical protein